MKILGLIPARGGSKGVPGKNIKLLGGKPLVAYSIEVALAAVAIDTVFVSTDDPKIQEVSLRLGAQVPFLRPAHLATDHSPTVDTVIHSLRYFQDKGQGFDAVCLLQPTSPLRTAGDLEAAIQIFEQSGADSLVSVLEVPHQFNPHWTFVPKADADFLNIATGEKEIISRRQDLPNAYYRNGAIYLTRSEVLLEQGSLYGEKIAYYQMKKDQDINIDTLEDWEKAELYFATNNEKPTR